MKMMTVDREDLAEPEPGPAAHSMDTAWFAVDAHGHIGVFDSGEGGGVPEAHFEAWHAQTGAEELFDLLLGQPASAGVRFDDRGVFEPDRRRGDPDDAYQVIEAPEGLGSHFDDVLIELGDPAAASDARLLAAVGPYDRLIRLPGERVLVRGGLELPTLAQLWTVLGIVRVRLPYSIEAGRLGLFRFGCDDYSAGPYQRCEKPTGVPVRIEQLSPAARRLLGAVIFPAIDFRSDHQVQPFEHLPSTAWSEEWLGTDGQMHPV